MPGPRARHHGRCVGQTGAQRTAGSSRLAIRRCSSLQLSGRSAHRDASHIHAEISKTVRSVSTVSEANGCGYASRNSAQAPASRNRSKRNSSSADQSAVSGCNVAYTAAVKRAANSSSASRTALALSLPTANRSPVSASV